jgi:hypothetical protein
MLLRMPPVRLHVDAIAILFAMAAMFSSSHASAQPTGPVASPANASVPANGANVGPRAKYDAGTSAFADGRFVEAALDFEAAAGDQPNAVALYTAALSWEKAGVPDRAADDYARALAMGGLPPDEAERATQRLAMLEGALGAVLVTGATDETRVQLDANTELPTPAKLHAAAGVHALIVRTKGRPIERMSVVLSRGTTTKLDISGAQSGTSPTPPPPEAHPTATSAGTTQATPLRNAAGFAILGAGATALLAGALLGVQALGARDAYNAAPTSAGYDHATAMQTWTTAAFVSGGVLAAAGLVLVLWPATPTSTSSSAAKAAQARRGGVLVGALGNGIRITVDL